MQHGKTTKITMHADRATRVTSSLHGSNINVTAFNMDLITPRKPLLALEIMRLYIECRTIETSDPTAHDEDQEKAIEELNILMREVFGT